MRRWPGAGPAARGARARWAARAPGVLQGAGLTRVVKPLAERSWVTWLRRGLLLLLVLEVVLFLPALAEGIVQTVEYVTHQQEIFQLPSVPVYDRLVTNELLFFNVLHPQVYVIPGGALWLLRFPKP